VVGSVKQSFGRRFIPKSFAKTAGKFPRPLETQTYSFSDQPFCRIADRGDFSLSQSIAKLAFSIRSRQPRGPSHGTQRDLKGHESRAAATP
jgi:hypothetical protein